MRLIYFSPMANNLDDWVKQAMVGDDICHREEEFTKLLQRIRGKLIETVKGTNKHSAVIIGGSGTAAIESVMSSLDKDKVQVLFLDNGYYGTRMRRIARRYELSSEEIIFEDVFKLSDVEGMIKNDKVTHVAMVHHETSTGTLNPLRMVGRLCKKYNKKLIVDAISSIGVQDLNIIDDNISYLMGSSNKGIGGAEGISFVIVEKTEVEHLVGNNYYLSLRENLLKQNEGQTLFTPAVRIFQGFDKALDLLREEGIENRQKRFVEIAIELRKGMKELGFEMLTQCPSSVTSLYSLGKYDFNTLHKQLKSKGYVIYTGLDDKTFRLCTYGTIQVEDIKKFLEVMKEITND